MTPVSKATVGPGRAWALGKAKIGLERQAVLCRSASAGEVEHVVHKLGTTGELTVLKEPSGGTTATVHAASHSAGLVGP